MLDVVQALELFEICADEIASEDASVERGRRRMTLTARALAKHELRRADLAGFYFRRYRYGAVRYGAAAADEPTMTLGAMIVFRTADKFVRAGASPARTLDGLYHAVQQYVEIIPSSRQDGVDKTAVNVLLTEAGESRSAILARIGISHPGPAYLA